MSELTQLQNMLINFKEHIKEKMRHEDESHTYYWYSVMLDECDDILQEIGLEQMATCLGLGTQTIEKNFSEEK